jgi:cytoskeletal protein CcmA (bactofilin family)
MFNKREQHEEMPSTTPRSETAGAAPRRDAGGGRGSAAVIGPSIEIDGQLKGEEDLVVEGRIKGTVTLKQHTLTVGSQGTLDAEVFAHSILVDGTVNGDLYASERISIRKSARIQGNILSPRISLEDGAKFRGSIDMDPESEAFRKAFGKQAAAPSSTTPAAQSGGRKEATASTGSNAQTTRNEGQTTRNEGQTTKNEGQTA